MVDSSGFEEAMKIAKKYGTLGKWDENDLRTAFYVRLALSLLYGDSEECCKKSLLIAMDISKEKTLEYIDLLCCEPECKALMKNLIA